MSAKYDETYQLTHDIDWFCRIGNTPMHFASNGGILPDKVNDREINSSIQHKVALMEEVLPDSEQIVINQKYVIERLGEEAGQEAFERYLESFVAMARKGFYSFDRMLEGEMYMWIAKPAHDVAVPIDELPSYEANVCGCYAYGKEVIHLHCLNMHQEALFSENEEQS